MITKWAKVGVFCTLVLALAIGIQAAGAFVQKSFCTGVTTAVCASVTNTTGNTLVAIGICNSATASPTITDTQGNTYTAKFTSLNLGGAGTSVKVFEAKNITGGVNVATVAVGEATGCDYFVTEYSGLDPAGSFDVATAARDAATTSHSSGNTAATSFPNEMVVGLISCNAGTITVGSGFTSRATDSSQFINALEDKNVTSTGVQAATATTSVNRTCENTVATFKATVQPSSSNQVGIFLPGP